MAIITLTTDFGLHDEYVGVMKGVILGRVPSAHIVDLCHAIAPHDIRMAAYLISASYAYFPAGTIHVIVVDPGVGGSRDIVICLLAGQIFLAPDNGVLTLLLEENPGVLAYRAVNPDLFLSPCSKTFQGRDMFAPLAAYLGNGGKESEAGPEIEVDGLQRIGLNKPQVERSGLAVSGEIIHIDTFGNAISNIRESSWDYFSSQPFSSTLVATINGVSISSVHYLYQAVDKGKATMLFNSRGYLEIAVNQGNAASLLEITLGDQLVVTGYRDNLWTK